MYRFCHILWCENSSCSTSFLNSLTVFRTKCTSTSHALNYETTPYVRVVRLRLMLQWNTVAEGQAYPSLLSISTKLPPSTYSGAGSAVKQRLSSCIVEDHKFGAGEVTEKDVEFADGWCFCYQFKWTLLLCALFTSWPAADFLPWMWKIMLKQTMQR